MPARYRKFTASWKAVNLNWEYRLWDRDSLRLVLEQRWSGLLPAFDGTPWPGAQADIGRYAVLEAHGGLYADVDTLCVRSIDRLLRPPRATLVVQDYPPPQFYVPGDPPFKWVTNSIILSAAGHPIWRPVLTEISTFWDLGPFWWLITGPGMFRRHAAEHADQHPEDVEVQGPPRIVTSYTRPEWRMRLEAMVDPRALVLDFNDSARASPPW
ncbi:MAG: glycosyltransferase [Enhygromyxa sp.]